MDPDAAAGTEDEFAPEGFREELAIAMRATVEVFHNPDLRRAQIGLAAFTFIDLAAWVALLAYAYTVGEAAAVGLVSIVLLVPAAIAAPFGAVLGDRGRRERVLLGTFLAVGVLFATTAVALFAGASLAVVLAPALLVTMVLTLVRPLHASLVPWLVRRPEELTATYASAGLLESIGYFVGPALAGVLLGVGDRLGVSGTGLVFAVAAVLMLASAVLVARITVHTAASRGERTGAFVSEALAGLRYVWSDPRPRLLVSLLGSLLFFYGIVQTLMVVLAFRVLHTGQAGVGFLASALGVGAIVGGAVAVALAAQPHLTRMFRGGIFLTGLPVASLSLVTAPALVTIALGLSGAGGLIGDVSGKLMLQRLVPDEKLTRAFGVLESIYLGAEGMGGLLGALLVGWLGMSQALLVTGLLLPAAALLAHRGISHLDVGVRFPEEEIAVLRRTSIFAALPPAVLERLARNLVPQRVRPGDTVIREGDVGDRFYVIRAGDAAVSVAGQTIASLGPGDYFGEIALLRDVLRTATVVAVSDLDLLSLERDMFLEVLTGHPASRDLAVSEATRRSPPGPDAIPRRRSRRR